MCSIRTFLAMNEKKLLLTYTCAANYLLQRKSERHTPLTRSPCHSSCPAEPAPTEIQEVVRRHVIDSVWRNDFFTVTVPAGPKTLHRRCCCRLGRKPAVCTQGCSVKVRCVSCSVPTQLTTLSLCSP